MAPRSHIARTERSSPDGGPNAPEIPLPKSPAVVHFGQRRIALAELQARGARAAHALAAAGIGGGDVVALLMRNDAAFVEALTCIRCLDAVLVLVPWYLTARELLPVLEAVTPRLMIVHADLVPRVLEAAGGLPETRVAVVETPLELVSADHLAARSERPSPGRLSRWEDLVAKATASLPIPACTIQTITLTSGSTGVPKVIRREGAQRWIQWAVHCTRSWPTIKRSIVTAPLCHSAQYGVFSQACHVQADQVIMPSFEPEAFLRAVEAYRVNHAYLNPPMFVRLLKLPPHIRARYDVSSLNYILQTGAPCAPDIKRQMIKWLGPVIWEAYGANETSTIAACSSEEWLARPTSVGRPLRRVLSLDDQGKPRPSGQSGRIYVDVSDMPRIIYQNGEAVRRVVDGAEFISVGDVGFLDEDGYLSLCGRTDDRINNGRLKVYPEEIENVILRHPGVQDCIVFGVPDAECGQVIAAVVEVANASRNIEAELRDFLRGRISEYKIPAMIWAQSQRLRPDSGKINRRLLAASVCAASAGRVLPLSGEWRPAI